MHGYIMQQLQSFIIQRAGEAGWQQAAAAANLPGDGFSDEQEYPDAETLALVDAAAVAEGVDRNHCLEAFGRHLVPDFVDLCLAMGWSQPQWRALDYISSAQTVIHTNLRKVCDTLHPAPLLSLHYAPDKTLVIYRSPRRLCALARGVVGGLAERFDENLQLEERQCMQQGADACWLFVRRVG